MSYLTQEERKEKISHVCDYFQFESCADLSKGVTMTLIYPGFTKGAGEFVKLHPALFVRDMSKFLGWWLLTFHKRLNGFSGLDTINYKFAENEKN